MSIRLPRLPYAEMPFDQVQRRSLLRVRARAYVEVALANVVREYPHMPQFVSTEPGDYRGHREFHPAFFGSLDWHSCVEMHWVIVRLLREFPELVPQPDARATLDSLLTPAHLARETEFFGAAR